MDYHKHVETLIYINIMQWRIQTSFKGMCDPGFYYSFWKGGGGGGEESKWQKDTIFGFKFANKSGGGEGGGRGREGLVAASKTPL